MPIPTERRQTPLFHRIRPRAAAALLLITFAICAHVALVKQPPPYRVVTGAAERMLEGQNPYAPQPSLDLFKYSPLAGLIVAPFNLLPSTLGILLFTLGQFWFLLWAFERWARAAGYDAHRVGFLVVAVVSVMPDATTSIQNAQVNVGIFGLMLLGAALYSEKAPLSAGLVLSLATNLKLFPFTLGLCFLTGFDRRFWVGFLGGLSAWIALPAVWLGWSRNTELLQQWIALLEDDATRPQMLDIGSFVALHFGAPDSVRTPLALIAGAAVGFACLRLFRNGETGRIDRFLVPINGLYVLLFSYLSESPTSILAAAGIFVIGMAAVDTGSRAWWMIWVVALALVPLFYTDAVPRAWGDWARAFHLKTVGYGFVLTANVYLFSRFDRLSRHH